MHSIHAIGGTPEPRKGMQLFQLEQDSHHFPKSYSVYSTLSKPAAKMALVVASFCNSPR